MNMPGRIKGSAENILFQAKERIWRKGKEKSFRSPSWAASIIATKGSLRNLETPSNRSSQEELKRTFRRLPNLQRNSFK
jgi:hypothetical protein